MAQAGSRSYRRPVAKRERTSGTSRSAPLQLPPDRAFVLHLDVHACPPRRLLGRVEHIASGRVTHVTSVRGLLTFLIDVLRDEAQRTETSHPSETIGRRDER
jgi:hypothetical protein